MSPPDQVVVIRAGNPGVVAGIFGCILGLLGIFTVGIIFVPLAAICSLVGLLRGLGGGSAAGIGTSLLGFALTVAGFFVSPTLMLATGLSMIAYQFGHPDPPAAVAYRPPARPAPAPMIPAGSQVPQFRDYRADSYSGPRAALVLATNQDNTFRTRLREAAGRPANFAGSYSLGLWGCGTDCVMGAAVDLKTGHVVWLPSTICCWPMPMAQNFQPVQAQINSTLILLTGLRNEKEGDQGTHFYSIQNEQFVTVWK